MTDRLLIGAFLAVVVEAPHWLKIRWDFNDEAIGRAWKLCVLLISLAGAMIVLDGNPYQAMPALLTWLPPLLLPMQFVQAYGLAPSMPLNTFSFVAKQRRKRNLRLGLQESVVHFNFGNFYFVATLVAATLGRPSSGQYQLYFLPGLIVLTGWMLLSASKTKPLPLIVCLAMAGGISLAGQKGLDRLNEMFGNSAPGGAGFNPNATETLIGKPGEVEQSPDIVWRLRTAAKVSAPRLLRTATYNSYSRGKWRLQTMLPEEAQFKVLDTILTNSGEIYNIAAPELQAADRLKATDAGLPDFELRGAAFSETPMPLPGDVASLHGFELDSIERNVVGTIRVFPKHSVIQGSVLWSAGTNPESPPDPKYDLRKSSLEPEKEVLQSIADELRLADLPDLEAKLATIRAWFSENFTYSRTLTINENERNNSAIAEFLTNEKAGHCEYFATATVLLLRQAGIPARYAIGYAVTERDPSRNEFVIRGTHGHAWCRVWNETTRRWQDFDTTPAVWTTVVETQVTQMQRFQDSLRRLREDFFLWRNQPGNRLAVTLVMAVIAIGVVVFILRRLWKSKRRLEKKDLSSAYTGAITLTPLNDLEPRLTDQLGPRPPGQPLAEWLLRLRPDLEDAAPLDEAIELHRKLRFDPAPENPADRVRLAMLAQRVQSASKRG